MEERDGNRCAGANNFLHEALLPAMFCSFCPFLFKWLTGFLFFDNVLLNEAGGFCHLHE